MNNIMIDLEALGTSSKGVIVSLGAVAFDIATSTLGDTFYSEISIEGMQEQRDKGRHLNLETMQWWMQQSDSARSVFFPSQTQAKEMPTSMLNGFRDFCLAQASIYKLCIWGNGATFDNVMLRDLYNDYKIQAPWHFRGDTCYRTAKVLFGYRAKLVREGAHHNGLDDAITQAKHLLAMFKGLDKGLR